MSRAQLEELQLSRLQRLLVTVYERVPLYHAKFDEAGFDPASVKSLEDLARAPFTVKDDMRAAYPYGMFAAPLRDIVRVHSSSGTTGQVTVVGYTKGDIDRWSDLMARTFASAGATADDVVQVTYGYGLFTGGLGAHYGSERLGALTIPVSGGNTKRQVQILKDFGVTVLACTPSYALLIAETALEMGIDLRDLPLRVGVFGAEPWSENMRRQVERTLGITAIDIYGLSEVMGPGVASECVHQNGLHVFEDHFLIEIIDPETMEPVPDGEYGRGRVHDAHQGGHPGRPLPHTRHQPHRPGRVRLRTYLPAHGARHGPHRRHAHHPGRQRLPEPDRAGPHGGSRASRRTIRSCSASAGCWTMWRCA